MSSKLSLLVTSLALLTPALGLSTTVSINSVCVTPNCLAPDTLNSGGSTASSLANIWTMPNGDQYWVTGDYGASYSNATVNISANPSVQYIGNIVNKTAPSQGDILTFNFYQNYNYTDGSADGYYYYFGQSNTSGGVAPGSSYTINLGWDGQFIGSTTWGLGFSGNNLFNQRLLTGLVTDPLAADEFISFYFAPGSDPGATFATVPPGTVTPEPSSILLLAVGGLGLLGFTLKRSRRNVIAREVLAS